MVEGYRRGKGKKRLLGNHQKCWIWGKNAVGETLRAGRWPMHELRLSETLSPEAVRWAREVADRLEVPVHLEPNDTLTRRCRSAEHQGWLAKMAPYPYCPLQQLLSGPGARPLYLVLDAIQDPYNFGAILRSAEAMGVDGVLVRSRGQAGVTSLVARTSAGAVNHLRLCRCDDLPAAVQAFRTDGVRVFAATLEGPSRIPAECDFTGPSALVLGNEGAGIAEDLAGLAEERIRIPQCGRVESLNAAVAAGILLYEVRRQRAVCRAASQPTP